MTSKKLKKILLNDNSTKNQINHVMSFDIETFKDGDRLIPYCVSIHSNNIENIFYGLNCIDQFIEYIMSLFTEKKKLIYIFSHNLTFDGSILLQNLNKDFTYTGLFFKGNIYSLELRNKRRKIILKCSYRFFPTKLSNAHKLNDIPHKMDIDHTAISKNNFMNFKDVVSEYCINDAKICYMIIREYDKIISKFDVSWIDSCYSLPGISFNIFIKKFNKFKLNIETSVDDDSIFRPAYYGGRCEVFGNSTSEFIYHFDYTGMYAQVMMDDFWYGDYEVIRCPQNITNNGYFYIDAYSNMILPVLPYYSNEKLVFPNGYISGLFYYEEILLHIEMGGRVDKIHYHLKFNKKEYLFKEFVEKFSKMRRIDNSNNILCKLITNSLYGRLGMSEVLSETKIISLTDYPAFRIKNENRIIKESVIGKTIIIELTKKNIPMTRLNQLCI